jgi:hypothetical protein
MAKEALEKKGFELVKFSLSKEELFDYNEVMSGLVGNFGVHQTLREMISNHEPWVP